MKPSKSKPHRDIIIVFFQGLVCGCDEFEIYDMNDASLRIIDYDSYLNHVIYRIFVITVLLVYLCQILMSQVDESRDLSFRWSPDLLMIITTISTNDELHFLIGQYTVSALLLR